MMLYSRENSMCTANCRVSDAYIAILNGYSILG